MDKLREKLTDILSDLFGIGDSYHYTLGRVKEAFAVGTMSVADFEEYNEESVAEIVESLIQNGVEIPVRCKDCVYYIADGEHCGWWNEVMPPDGYCHKGEKDNSTQECQACAIEGLDQPEVL